MRATNTALNSSLRFLNEQEKLLIDIATDPDCLWLPYTGPQLEAFLSPADRLFYGGAAGGGKTDLLLGLALYAHTRSIIFRRENSQVEGIEERLRAVQRFLERHPEWVGRFSFIQIAAPTRSSIEHYQAYDARVRALVMRINTQFSAAAHPPIILHAEHHEPREVYEYYRASELCFVSSLHDGMNLVAKEFVAARDDERGALVLSQFTGAARELPEAIVVNPYDAEECAEALYQAVTMPAEEQR
ncbi:MAG: trehalose-6-phosphate synthase, partial [Pleurocapsa sp. SU_196_0]|nr:trehalose-6-phosphate synthase [Pleurocapsa sp. SU_196_0]